MKSESLVEAHARFVAMSEAEKEGAAAASEGQMQPLRNPALEERAAQLNEGDEARLERLDEISRGGGDMILAGTQDEEVDPNWALTAHQNTREGNFGQSAPRASRPANDGGEGGQQGVRSDSTRSLQEAPRGGARKAKRG